MENSKIQFSRIFFEFGVKSKMRLLKTIYKHCVKFKVFLRLDGAKRKICNFSLILLGTKKMALSLYCFVLLLTLCLDAMTSGNFRISSPLPMKELEPRFGRSILSWLGSFLFRVPYTKTYILNSLFFLTFVKIR